jgi:hypothetical protein
MFRDQDAAFTAIAVRIDLPQDRRSPELFGVDGLALLRLGLQSPIPI